LNGGGLQSVSPIADSPDISLAASTTNPSLNSAETAPITVPVTGPVTSVAVTSDLTSGNCQCDQCEGGNRFEAGRVICPKCRALKPIAAGYAIDPSLFQWAQDGKAMATLRSITPLNAIATRLSDQAGRRWVESSFNGVRLNEAQMPKVYFSAVRAARILGLRKMPDIYVSGERPWDALTFGTNENAFVVMGSALVSSFRGAELMFLFAREMGHVLAGHALWKTVSRFLVGDTNRQRGLMKNGITGLIDPGKWLEGAIEVPLLSWARQAEITADRAGMLAIGNMATVRRVLLSWSLKSPFLYQQINVREWLRQQADDAGDNTIRLSELINSSTPYITRRLKLISDFDQDPVVGQFKQFVSPLLKQDMDDVKRQIEEQQKTTDQKLPGIKKESTVEKEILAANPVSAPTRPEAISNSTAVENSVRKSDDISINHQVVRIPCKHCQTSMAVLRSVLADKEMVPVKCPSPECGQINVIKPKPKSKPDVQKKEIEQQNLQSAF
jgi:Zn-dependent protease with chaperone function